MADGRELFCSRLSNFLLQPLAYVANALVLVRIGRTQGPHLGRHLSDFLPIDSVQREPRLLGVDRAIYAGWQRVFNRMREAQIEHNDAFALHLGAVSDAYDFELPRPTLGHAFDRIVDQRARQAVYGSLR